ncbi:hypothetical protein MSAN_00596500 [Mycena sanguinolenta]|uniref:Uncharacterized protein n=1 Tax=Mycena sanguinolenta TaxID=230812 RepID=A0A8H6ZBJ6_9AGAR|nr:hypothetical protein MSAN_00596500 [Mycena sanguinolenta]
MFMARRRTLRSTARWRSPPNSRPPSSHRASIPPPPPSPAVQPPANAAAAAQVDALPAAAAACRRRRPPSRRVARAPPDPAPNPRPPVKTLPALHNPRPPPSRANTAPPVVVLAVRPDAPVCVPRAGAVPRAVFIVPPALPTHPAALLRPAVPARPSATYYPAPCPRSCHPWSSSAYRPAYTPSPNPVRCRQVNASRLSRANADAVAQYPAAVAQCPRRVQK